MSANTYYDVDLSQNLTKNRFIGLMRVMKGYRVLYLGAIIALAIAATARTGIYLVLRRFIDEIVVPRNFGSDMILIIGLYIGMALLQGTFTFISGWLAARVAEGTTRRLRNFLYDHLQRLPYAYHAEAKTGDLISRATSDIDAVNRFFADQAIGIGRIILIFVINFIAIMQLHPRLAWTSVIAIPAIIAVSLFFFSRVSKAYEAYQEQEATLSNRLQENLTGVRVVKAFARQGYESYKFDQENWHKFSLGRRLLSIESLFWPISDIICGAQLLASYFTGAIMALNGEITVGTYMAFIALVIWIIWPMRNLGRLIVQTSTGMVSYKRVAELLEEKREPLLEGDYQPDGDLGGEIVFKDVSFEYEPGQLVLNKVNFSCSPGAVIALLGSTGSGKTTLVNLLPRFYDPTAGLITLDGVDITRYPRKYLRSQIGIVEQEPFLFSRSIRENITYGVHRQVSEEEIVQAAQFAAIHDVILEFPKGYDTLVGERGVTLSGGQKQRLAIARAVLKNPRILILDDSTSSVDTETEMHIRAALERLMQTRTTFIIAHRIQSVMDADLILVFDRGEIVQLGTHQQLMQTSGMYQDIFNIQTRIELELEKEISGVNI
ncbi:MAG TPA: ABC transporter ATP-binding protein [Brevefilum sp.]|nr:ABC transporter ATP-binding protein [Brevefilum sp.]HOR19083.1 ABC transporter ATP-binding protein [Brevefilum sp.]HPL68929.1 ABC transporter ATP-binding protein [Brevefilum sp.]